MTVEPLLAEPPLTEPTPAIAVTGLTKSFGTHTVLSDIDLRVDPGTVFALLGPNGAGKTTMVRILTTLGRADRGRIRIAGHDPAREVAAVRGLIGVTGQNSTVDGVLTGTENLRLMARLLHLDSNAARTRVGALLDRFGLTEAADRRVATYSGGMRRRLDLAMSLLGEPRIVFLDEPTTGLDPRSRRELWQEIRGLVADGVTIFLTTQYLEEAEQLADRVALLDGGSIVAEGSPAELARLVPGGHIRVEFTDPDRLAAAARAVPEGTADEAQLVLRVPSDGGAAELRGLLDTFDDHAVTIDRLTVHTSTLDDVFFALTTASRKVTRS